MALAMKSMKKVAKKVMKKVMKKAVKKAMKKSMRKAMKKSKVGKKFQVLKGSRVKTGGGLKKENLTKNKAVSACS